MLVHGEREAMVMAPSTMGDSAVLPRFQGSFLPYPLQASLLAHTVASFCVLNLSYALHFAAYVT